MEFEWLKFGHVITIIWAITIAEGPILPMIVMVRRRDVAGLRTMIAISRLGERAANPLVLVSIGFGIAAALTGQIDLTASWLLAAYAVLVGAILLGALGGFAHEHRLEEAALASPTDAPSPELEALLRSRWTTALLYVPPLLMATIVLLMVTKPTLF